MAESPKKQGFLGHTARLFTRKDRGVYDDIHFQEREETGDETSPALECPEGWSVEAISVLAEATHSGIPSNTSAIEENTVPSWLWRRKGQGTGLTKETDARQIFDRVVGSAAYAGWKQGLFADESDAEIFFDDIRSLLVQRLVAIEPRKLAVLGLNWAYGLNEKTPEQQQPNNDTRTIEISNTIIDAIVSGSTDKIIRAKRQKFWPASSENDSVILRLSDVASDWGARPAPGVQVTIDLMGFRHNDGWINIEALRQAVRLTVILLDLHDSRLGNQLEIGFHNLAPLLMALAIPYNSDGGRSTAAAISAIITAEAYATSAELAGLRGASAEYTANRETTLRVLRNHRRAAYGDRNDYEKISVLPAPLMLEHSPDLALVAVAQRRWEDALQLVRQHGLRHMQVTSLTSSPALTVFTESAAQGIAPLPSLTITRPAGTDLFRQDINPSVLEALARLGYDQAVSSIISHHIAGIGTLERAPGVNHTALRGKGFDEAAIARVEDYLRYVNDIHLAFTPWIVGEEFCRKTLKISANKIANPRFDLLQQLGFSTADIASANAFCYGHGSIKSAKEMRQQHASVFSRADEIQPEARIRMAAAVQSFISGDAGLRLSIPAGNAIEKNESLLLAAWRQGIKSISITNDAPAVSKKIVKKPGKKIQASGFLQTKQAAPLPTRRMRPKAGSSVISLSRGKSRSGPSARGKRS